MGLDRGQEIGSGVVAHWRSTINKWKVPFGEPTAPKVTWVLEVRGHVRVGVNDLVIMLLDLV